LNRVFGSSSPVKTEDSSIPRSLSIPATADLASKGTDSPKRNNSKAKQSGHEDLGGIPIRARPRTNSSPPSDTSDTTASSIGSATTLSDQSVTPVPDTPISPTEDKKSRRAGSVSSKARDIFSSAKQSLNFSSSSNVAAQAVPSSMQKLSKGDPALGVPQGAMNNSAGESHPGPNSTFRVGVTEDRNKKCRRTMEDTHAYLYNFLSTPARKSLSSSDLADDTTQSTSDAGSSLKGGNAGQSVETDNGYFAIFDGHAGTFTADWCGKKLHLLLEDTIRKHPNTPIPELLDQTFTIVDQQLVDLPVKNSGCTAVVAVLRWEDRVPSTNSATGSAYINVAAAQVAAANAKSSTSGDGALSTEGSASQESPDPPALPVSKSSEGKAPEGSAKALKASATRQRVLYTANVGDARIILCRSGKALRLSYDHKGSDENEGRRVHNAGGLILNNRVNGVLAVTRALGDSYMKDLVTGHPYTTETVIQEDVDEFMILACDGVSNTSLTDLELTEIAVGRLH
jgi:protein phosphatase PTC1